MGCDHPYWICLVRWYPHYVYGHSKGIIQLLHMLYNKTQDCTLVSIINNNWHITFKRQNFSNHLVDYPKASLKMTQGNIKVGGKKLSLWVEGVVWGRAAENNYPPPR